MTELDLNKLWEALSIKLNAAGPPTYTIAQWKKKWTSHKYNVNARKRKSNRNVVMIPQKVVRIGNSVYWIYVHGES